MFEWSLIESTALKPNEQTRWFFLGTMVVYVLCVQIAIVGSILAVSPELKQRFISSALVTPPPPPPAPMSGGLARANPRVIQIPSEFVAPERIPEKLPPVNLPFVSVPLGVIGSDSQGVPGGVPGGTWGGVPGGIIGGAGVVEVPPTPPAVVESEKKEPPRRVSQGVLIGNAIRKVTPTYPSMARAARVQGCVQVEIVIDESGNVVSAQVVSGHPFLQQAALDAAAQWKFRPTLLSGQPIKVSGILIFNFTLFGPTCASGSTEL